MVRVLFLSTLLISLTLFAEPPRAESPYARALREARELEKEAARARDRVDAARIDAIGALQQLDSLLQSAYRAELRNLDYLQTLNDKVLQAEKDKVAAIRKGDRAAIAKAALDMHYKMTGVILVMEKIKEKTNLVAVERELGRLTPTAASAYLKTAQSAAKLNQLEILNSKNNPEEVLAFFKKELLEVQLKAIEKELGITRQQLTDANQSLKPIIENALKNRIKSLDDFQKAFDDKDHNLIKSATDDSLKPVKDQNEKVQLQALERVVFLLDATTFAGAILTDDKANEAMAKMASNMGGAFFMLMKAHIARTVAPK